MTREDAIPHIAKAMEAKRAELINQPLARIGEDLAAVAFAHSQEIQTGSPVGREYRNEEVDLMPIYRTSPAP